MCNKRPYYRAWTCHLWTLVEFFLWDVPSNFFFQNTCKEFFYKPVKEIWFYHSGFFCYLKNKIYFLNFARFFSDFQKVMPIQLIAIYLSIDPWNKIFWYFNNIPDNAIRVKYEHFWKIVRFSRQNIDGQKIVPNFTTTHWG